MNKLILTALLSAAVLSGCALPADTVLSMSEVRGMDYGSYPRQYERQIKQHLAQTLIDPNSVMYGGFTPPRKYLSVKDRYQSGGLLSANKMAFTYSTYYLVCARINAKNSYGGYTGWQVYGFYFKNNEITHHDPYGGYCDRQDEIIVGGSGASSAFFKLIP